MLSCFNIAAAAGGGRMTENDNNNRVVFDSDPYEYRDTTKGGYLDHRTRIYGRDADRDEIKQRLLLPTNTGGGGGEEEAETAATTHSSSVVVVPIVGIGGLGKTTLARYVYNDGDVSSHFDPRVWFHATENLDLPHLMREVIESATGDDECDGHPDLEDDLRRAVAGRRFLLVLDDVWDESVGELNRFKDSLRDAVVGSRILVTTRSEGVGRGLGGIALTHYLECLSDEDCWKLFRQMAFSAVREKTQGLERIGREIVEKFQGVPLIAKAIGSLLQFESDRGVWENVRDSEIWELPELANKSLSALKLSYDHLPSHLKRCYEYCSLFPKAYEIDRKKLVELWMAEGFVSPVVDACFNDLLLRSFFQEEDDYGHTTTYKMHDLFHDLTQYIVGDEHLTMDAKVARNIPKGCRRLVLICGGMISAISEAS